MEEYEYVQMDTESEEDSELEFAAETESSESEDEEDEVDAEVTAKLTDEYRETYQAKLGRPLTVQDRAVMRRKERAVIVSAKNRSIKQKAYAKERNQSSSAAAKDCRVGESSSSGHHKREQDVCHQSASRVKNKGSLS